MWFFLWGILSLFVLGVFLWSTAILQQQKKAWSAFAKKHNFSYEAGKFNEAPVMRGVINGRPLAFFNDSRPTADKRSRQFFTAIELELGSGMPTGAALATATFADFLSTLNMPQTYQPPADGWLPTYVVKTRDAIALAIYLTPSRLKVLQALFAMKTVETLLFFDEEASVLRFELRDPLRSVERLEKLVLRIGQAGQVLAPDQVGSENAPPAQTAVDLPK